MQGQRNKLVPTLAQVTNHLRLRGEKGETSDLGVLAYGFSQYVQLKAIASSTKGVLFG